MYRSSNARSHGFTFVELMFGTVLIVLCSVMMVSHLLVRYRATVAQRERVFAFSTARSLLAEIQARVEGGTDAAGFDDGDAWRTSLSLDAGETADSGLGGNVPTADGWLWRRQVRVGHEEGPGHHLPRVQIRVAKAVRGEEPDVLADITSLVHGHRTARAATRVLDVYLIAIENAPAIGVDLQSVRPMLEATISELEQSNPGLELRTHWITKASYGRDPHYTPAAVEPGLPGGVYAYPGAREGAAFAYDPHRIKGRLRVGDAIRHGFDVDRNPLPYALADRYNHAMRLPEEREFHAQRVQQVRQRLAAIRAARATGAAVPPLLDDMSEEPTLRLLLEDLHTAPERYRQAVVVNLHGELLPMPPVRNYSDAALDAVDLPGLRCVSHPEELRTRRDPAGLRSDPAVFRVYAYTEDPARYSGTGVVPDTHAITLEVAGLDLCDPVHAGRLREGVELENLYGGVPVTLTGTDAPTYDYRPFARAKDIYQPRGRNEMFYFAEFVDPGFGEEKYTLIWLFNTPVVSPGVRNSGTRLAHTWCDPLEDRPLEVSSEPARVLPKVEATQGRLERHEDPNAGLVQGLSAAETSRLYGLEYVPCPTGGFADFRNDLSAVGDGPKNSARWRLTIPGSVFRARWFVRRDGSRHRTRGDLCLEVTTSFRRFGGEKAAPVPVRPGTPRRPRAARSSTTYTWWAAQADAVPVTERGQFLGDPRHCPYRDLLVGDPDFGGAVNRYFTTLHLGGIDGTRGYPGLRGAGLQDGWGDGGRLDTPRYLDLLREGLTRSCAVFGNLGGFGRLRVVLGGEADLARPGLVCGVSPDRWSCMPWLGELCPDAARDRRWIADGNLPAGQIPGTWTRRAWEDVHPANHGKVGAPAAPLWGWRPFFRAVEGQPMLTVDAVPGGGRLTGAGLRLRDEFVAAVPDALLCDHRMSWAPAPPGGGSSDVARWRVLDRYLDAPGGCGAALLEYERGLDALRVAVHGLDGSAPQVRARFTLLGALAGVTSRRGRRDLPPKVLVEQLAETDRIAAPATLRVRWSVRAEGSMVGPQDLRFAVLYSCDEGATWRFAQDGELAVAGARHPERYHVPFTRDPTGTNELVMALPARRFPAGPLQVRVEGWRAGGGPHYAYHTREVWLRR